MTRAKPFVELAVPAVGLVLLSVLCFAHVAVRQAQNRPPSRGMELLWGFGLGFLIVLWVRSDYRRSRYWPCFEYDMFMQMAWPVLFPYYLVRTRGPKGLLIFVGMIVLVFASGIGAAVAALVLGVAP